MGSSDDKLRRLKSEGDLNLSEHRAAWTREKLDAQTLYWLEEDARYLCVRLYRPRAWTCSHA